MLKLDTILFQNAFHGKSLVKGFIHSQQHKSSMHPIAIHSIFKNLKDELKGVKPESTNIGNCRFQTLIINNRNT
jgi:uracil DNA glycosylase